MSEDTLRAIKPHDSLILLEDLNTMFPLICVLIESLKYLNRFFTPVQEFFFPSSGYYKLGKGLPQIGKLWKYQKICINI